MSFDCSCDFNIVNTSYMLSMITANIYFGQNPNKTKIMGSALIGSGNLCFY